MADPLILTLDLGPEAFPHFDGLRRRHFPAALNRVPAHATLFHHLPGEEERAVREVLGTLLRAEATPEVAVTGLRFLGRGVAFDLASPALAALRGRIAATFAASLTAQDRQGWNPHVTVQNKVAPDRARALHRALAAEFERSTFTPAGLDLWYYRGGPWERCAAFPFAGAA